MNNAIKALQSAIKLMTIPEAIAILEEFQEWRLGAETEMVHPKLLTKSINLILKEVNKKI